MPDLEISKLPELKGPGLAGSDVIPLTDISASETKKVTTKALIQSGIALIDDGSIPITKVNIPSVAIPDGSVTTDKLADGAVTDAKVAGVDGSKIANGSVAAGKLGDVIALYERQAIWVGEELFNYAIAGGGNEMQR